MQDHKQDQGFELNEPREGKAEESLLKRLFYMIIIYFMIQMAHTVLGLLTVIQFVIMAVNGKQPNEQLAEFGTTMGIWVAKAVRYQTAASEVKPWPWTELD